MFGSISRYFERLGGGLRPQTQTRAQDLRETPSSTVLPPVNSSNSNFAETVGFLYARDEPALLRSVNRGGEKGKQRSRGFFRCVA